MSTRDRTPVSGAGPEPLTGVFGATCVSAQRSVSKAGNGMVIWQFRLDNGLELRRWTLFTSTDLHETVTALGFDPKGVDLRDAAGRKCRLVISHDGQFSNIDSVRPL